MRRWPWSKKVETTDEWAARFFPWFDNASNAERAAWCEARGFHGAAEVARRLMRQEEER